MKFTDFTKAPTRYQAEQLHQADLDCLIRLPERTAYFWRERTNGPGWSLERWDDDSDHNPGVNGYRAPDLVELFDLIPSHLHVGRFEAECLDQRRDGPIERAADHCGRLKITRTDDGRGWSFMVSRQPDQQRFVLQGPIAWTLAELILIHIRTINRLEQVCHEHEKAG
jgi:hypothetical protein